jgi:hypothetical protein
MSKDLDPRDISSAFADHIVGLSPKIKFVTPLPPPEGAALYVHQDYCVDPLDVDPDTGQKTSHSGRVVAAAAGRRLKEYNDVHLMTPYEAMQAAVQEAKGQHVLFDAHTHVNCGKIWLDGAVTVKQQFAVRRNVGLVYSRALGAMKRYARADAKRITLMNSIGQRGSAPVVREESGGLYSIANEDYLSNVIFQYPLNPGFIDRLVAEQRAAINQGGVPVG